MMFTLYSMIDCLIWLVIGLILGFIIGYGVALISVYREDMQIDDWEPDQDCFVDDGR